MRLAPPKVFRMSKAGNRPGECEDDFRVSYPYHIGILGLDKNIAKVALADGASESAFAQEWAAILTEAFVADPPGLCAPVERPLAEWLESCQKKWNKAVPWDRIPWHGEVKTRAGALATLLGLSIGVPPNNPKDLCWRAVAVGDSCLFLVRHGQMAVSFPIDSAWQFNNSPSLICSNSDKSNGLWGRVSQLSGNCVPGDLLILASDALSQWMLARKADGGKPWEDLLEQHSRGQLVEWVNDLRQRRLIHNDDTTFIIIEVE